MAFPILPARAMPHRAIDSDLWYANNCKPDRTSAGAWRHWCWCPTALWNHRQGEQCQPGSLFPGQLAAHVPPVTQSGHTPRGEKTSHLQRTEPWYQLRLGLEAAPRLGVAFDPTGSGKTKFSPATAGSMIASSMNYRAVLWRRFLSSRLLRPLPGPAVRFIYCRADHRQLQRSVGWRPVVQATIPQFAPRLARSPVASLTSEFRQI